MLVINNNVYIDLLLQTEVASYQRLKMRKFIRRQRCNKSHIEYMSDRRLCWIQN